MADALTTEPTGGALAGVQLANALGDAGTRRIRSSAENFRSRLDIEREQLREFRGAIRRKQRGEAISDVMMITGLALGAGIGSATSLGALPGLKLGGMAGSIAGAAAGGEPAAPELQAVPQLAGNVEDQRDLADLETAAGVSPVANRVPEIPETPDLPAPAAPPPADLPGSLDSWERLRRTRRRSPVGI